MSLPGTNFSRAGWRRGGSILAASAYKRGIFTVLCGAATHFSISVRHSWNLSRASVIGAKVGVEVWGADEVRRWILSWAQ
jgi:hypothetical protein